MRKLFISFTVPISIFVEVENVIFLNTKGLLWIISSFGNKLIHSSIVVSQAKGKLIFMVQKNRASLTH